MDSTEQKIKVVLATRNPYKLQEFQEMMPGYEVLSMTDVGYTDKIEEDGTSFTENAFRKAGAVMGYLRSRGIDYTVIGEDSGLCVKALKGRPGIHTARYGGEHSSDQEKRDRLRKELAGQEDRSAHFSCVLAVYPPEQKENFSCVGVARGRITEEERGEHGFAFDSIFYSDDLGKTFAEATSAEKNTVSHRARAIEAMLKKLKWLFKQKGYAF